MMPGAAVILKTLGSSAARYAIKAVSLTKVSRRAIATAKRGRGVFNIPNAKTLILAPVRVRNGHVSGVTPLDQEATNELAGLFERLNFRKGTEWEARSLSSPLEAVDRQHSMIVLCAANPMAKELLSPGSSFLTAVRYVDAEEPTERRFEWNGEHFSYTGDRDYAVLAVKPNPYNSKVNIVLLAGLRGTGTRGACMLYALDGYRNLREQIKAAYGTLDGRLEVLLAIDVGSAGQILNVRIADPGGLAANAEPRRLRPIRNDPEALEKIYKSLKRYPRSVKHVDYVYGLTYNSDYSITISWEETWCAVNDDVVVIGREIGADPDVKDEKKLRFTVSQVTAPGVQDVAQDVVAVLVTNTWAMRQYLLFPIPPIRRGEPGRRIRSSAVWPEAAHKLRESNGRPSRETAFVPASTIHPVAKFTLRLDFALGGKFRVEPQFAMSGVRPPTEGYCMGKPFVHTIENAQPGAAYTLEVTRTA